MREGEYTLFCYFNKIVNELSEDNLKERRETSFVSALLNKFSWVSPLLSILPCLDEVKAVTL